MLRTDYLHLQFSVHNEMQGAGSHTAQGVDGGDTSTALHSKMEQISSAFLNSCMATLRSLLTVLLKRKIYLFPLITKEMSILKYSQ